MSLLCYPPGVLSLSGALTRIRTYTIIYSQTTNICSFAHPHILPNRTLHLRTEMGLLTVAPHEIVVVPRGIRFQVELEGPSRGYVLEVYQGHFQVRSEKPKGKYCQLQV
jgi:homogentisate 1,2-dioxygenase